MTVDYLQIRAHRLSGLKAAVAELLGGEPMPLTLEVGCGHGHFLTAYAAAFPGERCVGVDRESERIERALRKQQRSGSRNLHFIRGDADLLLQAIDSQHLFDKVFILFPDPWPKLRHRKHRLLQPSFLGLLEGHLGPSSRVYFRTDHAEYFADAVQTLAARPGWGLVNEAWPFEFETVFQQRAASHQSFVARFAASREISVDGTSARTAL